MRRTTKNTRKVIGILTADWHVREDVPVSRKDNFIGALFNKIDFIADLQKKYDCPVFEAGDLFNHWKPSPWLISKTIEHMPQKMYAIYGNHDLPQHSLKLAEECGLYTLWKAGAVQILEKGHWKDTPTEPSYYHPQADKNMFLWHKFIYKKKEHWKADMGGVFAPSILRKYPDIDLFVTGDNHEAFVDEYEGRLLVNPGSLMRTTANQIDFEPRVYLWYDNNTVKPVYLPIEKGVHVINREHLEKVEKRDERVDAFITSLNTEWEGVSTFEKNLDIFFKKNKVEQAVEEIVFKSIE